MAKRSNQPKCKMCKRPLKNPKSIANEIGPECAEKYAFLLVGAELTVEQLGFSAAQLADGEVRRWLHFATQAAIEERDADVERFRQSAIAAAQTVAQPIAA